jgi:diadenosine tetraphosphate (Ap4A) HIT family hydrolase
MPLTPEEFYENATAFADGEGRVGLSRMTGWEIFPFEPDGLRVVSLHRPETPEAPRDGEEPTTCRSCAASDGSAVWENDAWRLIAMSEPSGAPLVLMLLSKEHHDLVDLSDDMAAQLGQIIVHTSRAIESLEHIARAHVSRWGDGGAHLHIFFFARPEGFAQLRGTCLAVWDDLLAPVPRDVRDRDAARVGELLAASYGGTASVPRDAPA